jgi:hypothetical protein
MKVQRNKVRKNQAGYWFAEYPYGGSYRFIRIHDMNLRTICYHYEYPMFKILELSADFAIQNPHQSNLPKHSFHPTIITFPISQIHTIIHLSMHQKEMPTGIFSSQTMILCMEK